MAPHGDTPTDSDDEEVQEAPVAATRFDALLQSYGLDE